MTFTSLDTIVRSVLLQKGLPLHWYVQFLKYCGDAVRELSFDSMRVISEVRLAIDQRTFAADLPCDYIDWTFVGVPQGQFLQPLWQRDTISQLTNFTSTGQPTSYGDAQTVNMDFPFWPGYWMFQNIDDLGENVGRLFGYNTSFSNNFFKVIPERGQIQFAETLASQTCGLQYISSGQALNNATKIDLLAQAVIEARIDWQYKLHAGRRFSEGEVEAAFAHYKIELRRYRARKDDLTIADIRQSVFKTYIGAPKT